MDNKRPITPHKGGRNAAFPHSRLSDEERRKLDQILAHMGISAADWVAPKIHDDHRMIFGDEPQSAVQDDEEMKQTKQLEAKKYFSMTVTPQKRDERTVWFNFSNRGGSAKYDLHEGKFLPCNGRVAPKVEEWLEKEYII